MIISTNKLILLTLLAFGGIGIYPIYKAFNGKEKNTIALDTTINTSSSLEKMYVAQFQQERKEILEAIRKEFNIPQEKWAKGFVYFDYVCEKNKDILKENCKPIAHADEMVSRIKRLLAKNGVNPDKVTIEFNAEYAWPVATYQRAQDYDLTCSISINKEWFSQQSIDLQNAIISHEIMHIKHFDVFELNLILGILEANGITPEQYKDSKSLQKYHHLRELRADLMAGLHDIEVAKALHEDFCNCVQDKFMGDLSEHPSNKTRMDQMAHLIKDLQISTINVA